MPTDSGRPALIVFDPRIRSLWDAESSLVLERLEERLEDVFVTAAGTGGRVATLRDACAAARFAGCSEAVVVVVGGAAPAFGAGDPGLPLTTTRSERGAAAIAQAYAMARLPRRRVA